MGPDHDSMSDTDSAVQEHASDGPQVRRARAWKRRLLYAVIGTLVVWAITSGVLLGILRSRAGDNDRYVLPVEGARSGVEASVETSSKSIYEEYQEIIDGVASLRSEALEDAALQEGIQQLSEEVHSLRVLNPYYRLKEIKASFVPTGVPDVYGDELGISFDKVQDAINKVGALGPTYGKEGQKIVLTGADLERYISIGSQIACEYCCEATTLVKADGVAACGCEHSIMMRGLAAYLITNHPELSDAQVLDELVRWKVTFFPRQMLTKKLSDMEKGGEPGIGEVLQEFPEFLPQMVGGC